MGEHGRALYNEIDPFAAEWIRRLSDAGHVAPGVVDKRSVRDLRPADVGGPGQRHFFAGIGVWSAALRLAGWPDDVDVWTGSCPCQPFSGAGRRGGFDDDRHLWPAWFDLVRECHPPVIFGEQVASPDGLTWLDLVYADLEGAGYAVGASDLCAAGVGAPHIRQRLFFVAVADGFEGRLHLRSRSTRPSEPEARGCGETRLVGDADDAGPQGRIVGRHGADERSARATGLGSALADATRDGWIAAPRTTPRGHGARSADGGGDDGATRGFWDPCDWIPCRDGNLRPVEPGTFPLAHGATARVGKLRAYGNAIVRQVAATFIEAAIDVIVGEVP